VKLARVCCIGIVLLAYLVPGGQLHFLRGVRAQDAVRHEVFLPMVVGDPGTELLPTLTPIPTRTPTKTPAPTATPTATPLPTRPPVTDPNCDLLDVEAELAVLLRESPGQQRPSLVCNTILSTVARARARDMAERDYFDHINPDGIGPNYLVLSAGYPLPAYYDLSQTGNNIESIGAGHPTPDAVWAAWMASSYHRIHLLGSNQFFGDQDEYGVGYHHDPQSRYRHYWVVITARQAE